MSSSSIRKQPTRDTSRPDTPAPEDTQASPVQENPVHGRGRKAPKNVVGAAHEHRQKSHSTTVGSSEMREREAPDVDRQINRLAEEKTNDVEGEEANRDSATD